MRMAVHVRSAFQSGKIGREVHGLAHAREQPQSVAAQFCPRVVHRHLIEERVELRPQRRQCFHCGREFFIRRASARPRTGCL